VFQQPQSEFWSHSVLYTTYQLFKSMIFTASLLEVHH